MPEELIQTQIVATQETVEKPEEINVSPELSPEIQAEIKRLEAKKTELEKSVKENEEKAIYWRKQKAEARAEFFKGDRREEKPLVTDEGTQTLPPPPNKNDFDDYDKYIEAVADYRADLKLAKWQKEQTKSRAETDRDAKRKELMVKLDRGYEKYSDFEEVTRDPSLPITQVIVDVLAEASEHPEDVAYYLGKNRAEAIRLSRMNPIAMVKEIGRIEMEISKTPLGSNPKNIISNAPPPINPVGQGEVVNKAVDQMTQKEFDAMRKSQGAKPY